MRIREIEVEEDTSSAPVVQQRSLIRGKKLGARIKIASAPSAALGQVQAGTTQRLVHLQGDDDLAVPLTVFYDASVIASSGAGLAFLTGDAYLLVSWGAGGYNTSAEVDIGFGGCLTVFASSLTVDLVTPTKMNGVDYSMEVGAYACPGSRPGNMLAPTRTHRIVNAVGGLLPMAIGDSSTLLVIPPYAKGLTLIGNPTLYTTIPEFGLVLADSAGTEVARFRYGETMHSTQHHGAAPSILPGGLWAAQRYKIINTLGASVAMDRFFAIWSLTL